MWLIVGLGNPGIRYHQDRHNIGFRVIDQIAEEHQIQVTNQRFQGHFGAGSIKGVPVALLKPQTYMNLSGKSVIELVRFHNIKHDQIIVIHDELDLSMGQTRLKKGGGDGGHKGIRSISEELDNRNYIRLRFGISRPPSSTQVADYVLNPFTSEEINDIPSLLVQSEEIICSVCLEGLNKAMNRWNTRKSPKQAIKTPDKSSN